MLSIELGIDRQWKGQRAGQQEVNQDVNEYLSVLSSCPVNRKIANASGNALRQ
jgi:hypothetical protein